MPNLVANVRYQGPRGLSAYEVAVKNGYKGTEQEWVESQGKGIDYVTHEGSGLPGTYDTYTFHYVNGSTYSFEVYNGGSGSGDMNRRVYDTNENGIVDNAEKVNNHIVEKDVPADAEFTDTKYNTKSPYDPFINKVVTENDLGTQVTYEVQGTTLIITTKE